MKKQNTIRVGDRVTLTDPRLIIKVGYDRDVETIYREIRDDPRIISFCLEMSLRERDKVSVTKAVSRSILAGSLRDGTERKIFYSSPREDLRDRQFYVVSKHVRKTGIYQGPSGSYDYWGEYDYDPGGLGNEQAHVILELSEIRYRIKRVSGPIDYESGLYVCSTQVAKIEERNG